MNGASTGGVCCERAYPRGDPVDRREAEHSKPIVISVASASDSLSSRLTGERSESTALTSWPGCDDIGGDSVSAKYLTGVGGGESRSRAAAHRVVYRLFSS